MLQILKNKLGGECTFASFLKEKVKRDGKYVERTCVKLVINKKTLVIEISEHTTLDAILLAVEKFRENGS